jgi:hypothetical protein
MLTPANGQQVCGANASVSFSGFVPFASHSVSLQASASPSGPWQTIGTTVSSANGINYGGLTHYQWSATRTIPVWTSDGGMLHAYVRARVDTGTYGLANLTTFDVTPPLGSNALGCIGQRVQQGDNVSEAASFCASSESPVVEITAPFASTCPCSNVNVRGSVVIDSAPSAAAYVCTQSISGSLTVTGGAPEVVPLPVLQSIGGDLTSDYGYPVPSMGGAYRRRSIDLPVLAAIGGDASLTAQHTTGPNAMPLGLDAVTSVGGDITLTLYDANPAVFNGLTSYTGNLTIQGFQPNGNLDMSAAGSFGSLTQVTGDVLVQDFYATQNVLDALVEVTGNLTVATLRFYPSTSFDSLETVSGNLHFVEMKQLGPTWPSLVSVGGELGLIGQTGLTGLGALPVGAVAAHALRVQDNPALVDLTGASFQVGAGDITITGNTSLEQCEVDAFLAAQTAGGFTGNALVSDTLPCP